ncbi:MAG: helix-turn-helix domain-containing protein [Oceanicoccus sp.]
MNDTKITVPIRFVNTMLSIAENRNCNVDELIQRIGIDPEDIANNRPIPVLLYGELHHQIIEMVEDEWFGMLSGGAVPKGAIRLLCQTVVHCGDLKQLIHRSADFFEVCRGFKVKASITSDNDDVVISMVKLDCISEQEFEDVIAKTDPNTIKSTLLVWSGLYSWFIGKHIPVKARYFSFPENNNNVHYGTHTATPGHYDQSINGFRFDKKFLNYPIVQSEDTIEEFIRKSPYYALVTKNPDEGIAPAIKSLLARNIGHELPTASQVASDLNMSTTTLHRRLSGEGYSFQALKNELRMESAIHYLNRPDLSTSAISDLLGFENPSTFFRSFKKWTGLPPGEYRKQLLDKGALR